MNTDKYGQMNEDAIASQLKPLLPPDSQLINWDSLDSTWQERINRTIIATTPPTALVYPHSQEVLSKIITAAASNNWKVLPCGNGSKLSWGGLLQKKIDLLASTAKLNRVVEHAVDDLTVTVEAGVTLAELQEKLAEKNQFLPLDPSYQESATIGGIVATADAGSWRVGYGGVRDLVLGLSFVRADGKIAKAGGRVVKNVAGYDLMKLFSGSYGTLGIITQVTFRLYPLPSSSETVVLTGDREALAAARNTLVNSGLTPTAADLVSTSVVQKLSLGTGMGLILRFQSIPASVKEQGATVAAMGQELGLQASFYQDGREGQLWQELAGLSNINLSSEAITCKIGLLASAAIILLDKLDRLSKLDGKAWGTIRANSGLGQLVFEGEDSLEVVEEMRSLCKENHGFLTILTAPTQIKQQLEPWGYTGNALEIMRRIKQQFDPENLLSPGRFVGGI